MAFRRLLIRPISFGVLRRRKPRFFLKKRAEPRICGKSDTFGDETMLVGGAAEKFFSVSQAFVPKIYRGGNADFLCKNTVHMRIRIIRHRNKFAKRKGEIFGLG